MACLTGGHERTDIILKWDLRLCSGYNACLPARRSWRRVPIAVHFLKLPGRPGTQHTLGTWKRSGKVMTGAGGVILTKSPIECRLGFSITIWNYHHVPDSPIDANVSLYLLLAHYCMCVQWRSKRGGGSTPGTVFSFSSLMVGTFFCFLFSFCRGGQHFSWWWLKEATNSGSVSGMKSSSYPTVCMSDNMIKIMMTMATTIIVKKKHNNSRY